MASLIFILCSRNKVHNVHWAVIFWVRSNICGVNLRYFFARCTFPQIITVFFVSDAQMITQKFAFCLSTHIIPQIFSGKKCIFWRYYLRAVGCIEPQEYWGHEGGGSCYQGGHPVQDHPWQVLLRPPWLGGRRHHQGGGWGGGAPLHHKQRSRFNLLDWNLE